MTDSPHGGRESAQPYGDGYSGYNDPAYASQTPYGPTYQTPSTPAPTERLPEYSTYGHDPYATGQYGAPPPPPPEGPKSPRWLWVVAGIAVVSVIGLVIALVIVNSSRQRTVVAPLPDSTFTPEETATVPTTTSRTPSTPVLPLPTTAPSVPPTGGTTVPGAMQTVIYDVQGDGRAINITYVDTGGVLQTEFNVTLPWNKEVQLSQPASGTASVSVINVGREVDCSISIDGVVVQQRSGAGLTICTGTG